MTLDPRPDLAKDSPSWCDLLVRAAMVDYQSNCGLFQALDGLRCLGAQLVAVNGKGAKLIPGEMGMYEYQHLREKWLVPYRDDLTTLLKSVKG